MVDLAHYINRNVGRFDKGPTEPPYPTVNPKQVETSDTTLLYGAKPQDFDEPEDTVLEDGQEDPAASNEDGEEAEPKWNEWVDDDEDDEFMFDNTQTGILMYGPGHGKTVPSVNKDSLPGLTVKKNNSTPAKATNGGIAPTNLNNNNISPIDLTNSNTASPEPTTRNSSPAYATRSKTAPTGLTNNNTASNPIKNAFALTHAKNNNVAAPHYPQDIINMVQAIKSARTHQDGRIVRADCYKALPNDFNRRDNALRPESRLYAYMGDERLFTMEEWRHLTQRSHRPRH